MMDDLPPDSREPSPEAVERSRQLPLPPLPGDPAPTRPQQPVAGESEGSEVNSRHTRPALQSLAPLFKEHAGLNSISSSDAPPLPEGAGTQPDGLEELTKAMQSIEEKVARIAMAIESLVSG